MGIRSNTRRLLLNDVGDVAVGGLDFAGEGFTELLPRGNAHDRDQAENDDVFDRGETAFVCHELRDAGWIVFHERLLLPQGMGRRMKSFVR